MHFKHYKMLQILFYIPSIILSIYTYIHTQSTQILNHTITRNVTFLNKKIKLVLFHDQSHTGALQLCIHQNITILVFNSYSTRCVFCFLMTICIDRFNSAIWILPSLEVGSVQFSLAIIKLYDFAAISVNLKQNLISCPFLCTKPSTVLLLQVGNSNYQIGAYMYP